MITPPDVKERQLIQKAHRQLKQFLADIHAKEIKNKKILEIGFKRGLFLNECEKVGMSPTGTEIVKEFCDKAKTKFPNINFILSESDVLPFNDNMFDYIVSFQVFEHLETPYGGVILSSFLDDLIRTLKPGGIMYHRFPNYHSFYEGHYNVLWLPFLNKSSGKKYLKLLGKDPKQFDKSIDPIKPKKILSILEKRQDIEIISLGNREFINEGLNKEKIKLIKNKFVRFFFTLMEKLKLSSLTLHCISYFNFHYPMVMIVRKK